jgi:hypothetical protein
MTQRLDPTRAPTTNTAIGGMAPRHWAAKIVAIQTRKGRQQALEEVPAIIRGLVEDLVRCAFDRRNNRQVNKDD